jgi:hypothetical protein
LNSAKPLIGYVQYRQQHWEILNRTVEELHRIAPEHQPVGRCGLHDILVAQT